MATGKTQVSAELSRDLSLFHIVMMGLGMMIGAGIFLGIGISISEAGPGGVLLTFSLNGLIALFTAMSFAELSSAIPRAGGAYNFARIGFGRGTGFLAGWMEWFASSVAGSVYALTFAIYTVRYAEVLGWLDGVADVEVVRKVVAVLVATFFIYVNYRGASETGKVGAFFTLGQTLFMLVIGVAGVLAVMRDPSRLQNFTPFLPMGWTKLLVTMGFTYVAFEGFEVIAQAGDEVIDPKRNLPKAMLYSVFLVTLIYVLVAFATVVSVKAGSPGVEGAPWAWIGQYRETGFGKAVSRLMPFGNFLLTLAVIFSSTSALNATVYSATRAAYALGRDRMLPPVFARISSTRKTPWVALLFTGVIVLTVATLLPTTDVASSASIMFLFLFFLVNLCVIRIRLNMGDELSYGFLMPLFPLFPLLAIVCQAVLAVWLVHMSRIAWIVAPAWIAVGACIYGLYSKSRAVTTSDEILVLEEAPPPVTDQYQIMVAVANPDNALGLIRNTYKLCAARQAQVELLHMVPVPDQVPLEDAGRYMVEGKEAITEVLLYLSPEYPVGTTVRYCRNVARGIITAVREKKVDMLIMGWHGARSSYAFNLGSTVDPVMERTPCDVVVFKECGDRVFKRILVPVAGGPNGALALEVGAILADKQEGELCAFTVDSGRGAFDLEQFVDQNRGRIALPADRVHVRTAIGGDVVETILAEARDYDLVVLGCTDEPLLHRAARMTIVDKIARACDQPIVMVKGSRGIKSWIRRWV